MNTLLDLVNYIGERKVRMVSRKENQALQLYRGIKAGKFHSDEAAGESLFGDSPHRSVYYNSLKRKLKDLLYNTFLAAEAKKQDYWEKLHYAEKKNLVAQQLALQGMVDSAIRIMEEVLSDGKKMHFIPLARQAAHHLANWYAGTGDHARYRKHYELEQELWEKLQLERRAERCYYDLFDALHQRKGIGREVLEKARSYHEELAGLEVNTFTFKMWANYISVIYFELNNEGKKVVEACVSALVYFQSLPFELPNRTYRFFIVRMIPALLQQGQYRLALEKLEEAQAYVPKDSVNLAGLQEYRVVAGFHLQDLEIVGRAIAGIRSNRKWRQQKKEEVQVWEGYLTFLQPQDNPRFRLGRFQNIIEQYSADKKGMYINVRLIEVLILLRRRQLAPIIDRMEALRTYTYRHLKQDPATRRPDLFIQLLWLLAKHAFDRRIVQKKAEPVWQELQQEPRHLQAIDIEIVPYEVLWMRILELLE